MKPRSILLELVQVDGQSGLDGPTRFHNVQSEPGNHIKIGSRFLDPLRQLDPMKRTLCRNSTNPDWNWIGIQPGLSGM